MPGCRPTPVPRIETGLFIMYALAAGALSWTYATRKPEAFEKVGLLVFIISTFPILTFTAYPTVVVTGVTIGAGVLGFARLRVERRS
jgi:hypothetical protein